MSDVEPGSSIGSYRILSRLGAGGMGEVYLAEDRRLSRKLAVKVLPPAASEDRSRRTRFLSEARMVSSLNHPNIVTIYELGDDQGRDFIAMELVDGQSLRTLLVRGPLPVRRALEIAGQIASALAAGHGAGIVHRDIKPENVMVGSSGAVKVLDYGLAKATEPLRDPGSDSTTISPPVGGTMPGTVLGTVAYMSPEQAEGQAVDHRADIFSLGVVLYEMLSGRRPFGGTSLVDQLHNIVHVEAPPLSEIRPDVPPDVAELVARLMAKDPGDRYQHAGDLEHDLRKIRERLASGKTLEAPVSVRFRWPVAAGALALAITAALGAYWAGSRSRKADGVSLAGITMYPLTTDPGYEGEPTFSPDGRTLVYTSDRTGNLEIFLKQVTGGPDINLTNNPADDAQPSFSPDGREIAFVSSRGGTRPLTFVAPTSGLVGGDIWVMPALGGVPRRIAALGNFPSWSPDGTQIIFTSGPWRKQSVFSVSSSGGQVRRIPIDLPATHVNLLYPSFSRDGKWIAFEGQPDAVYVVPAAGGKAKKIATGRHPSWNRDSTEILFTSAERGKNATLWKVPFHGAGEEVAGEPMPLTIGRGPHTQATVSPDGHLIALAMQEETFNIEKWPFDPEGAGITGPVTPMTSGAIFAPFMSASPDGSSVAYETWGPNVQIWRADGISPPVQLTFDTRFDSRYTAWSPDGKRIAFVRTPVETGGKSELCLMAPDGADPQVLLSEGQRQGPGCVFGAGFVAWTPDSHGIAYWSVDQGICILDLITRRSRRVTQDRGVRTGQSFTFDGQWVIYQKVGLDNTADVRSAPVSGGPSVGVSETTHEDGHPFPSPSGRWIFVQYDHRNLYRVPGPAQGWKKSPPEKVTQFPESNLYLDLPQISRDGKWLFVSRYQIASDIWVMKLP